jgi:stage IV sporulation protein FB
MPPTLRSVQRAHFRIFGVPVRVEPFFVIVAVLMGFDLQPLWMVAAWTVVVFVSVLVHELGHAFLFRLAGLRSAVVLHAFGGFTIPTGQGRRALSKPWSIAVSLAGVAAQLLFLYLPARLLKDSDWGTEQYLDWFLFRPGEWFNWWPILNVMAFVSLWWAVFNLLPIRPLDGGHVVQDLVGFENACKISIGAAAVAAFVALTQWPFGGGNLFAALFFGLFAFMNYRDLREGQFAGSFDVEGPDPGAPGGRAGQGRGSRSRGGRGGRGSRGRRRSGHLQPVPSMDQLSAELSAGSRDPGEAEARAWNALRSGDGDRAAMMLKQSAGSPNGFLQASVALAQGHAGVAADLFESAYLAEPAGPPNLVPATLLADRSQAVPLTALLVAAGPSGVEAAGSLQTHLHYAERFQAAAEVGEQVFAAGPSSAAQTGFEVACSWARAGRPDEGLRWVEAAIDAGFKAPGLLDSEPDLASVRALPGWAAVRSRLST